MASLKPPRGLTMLALSGVLSLSACANTAPSASAGDHVTALDWQGTYQGPYHLFLAIRTHGDQANGMWRAVGGREGEFSGTISGARLDLDWREAGGNGNAWTGRGYFLFHGPDSRHPAQIFGERGMGSSASGDAWWAFKRANSVRLSSGELLDNARGADLSEEDRKCPGCDEVEWER